MRLSGSLPAVGRRVVVALSVAGMLLVASTVHAQVAAPAQAGQPEPPDPFMFKSATPVMVLLSINQGQEATFEDGFSQMKAGLAAADKPEFQQQARTMQLMKVDLPVAAGQPVVYVLYLDPPMTTVSYDFTKIFYYSGAFDVSTIELRKEVDAIYAKFTASLASQNLWPLVKK